MEALQTQVEEAVATREALGDLMLELHEAVVSGKRVKGGGT